MRLIDADMLLNSFKGAKKLGVDAIKYYVDNTPTIDLVRCKECKFQDECILGSYGVSEHGFCYKGERRADETNT